VQLKLAELIRSVEGAHNSLLDIEELSERDLDRIRDQYEQLARKAREERKGLTVPWRAGAQVRRAGMDG
jgi:low affinity Fe/Cu permease